MAEPVKTARPDLDAWVLVPAHPLPEMLGAFWRTKNTGTTEIGGEHQDSSDVAAYRAMVAAAPPGPWRPQLAGADRLGRDRKGDVTINVPTALCWLQFQPDVTTGTEDEGTRPGVGFTLVAYPGSAGEWPCGVIPRDEAFRLYEMLGRFFAKHPPSGEPAAQEIEAAAANAAPVQADRLRRIAAVLRGATVGGPSHG